MKIYRYNKKQFIKLTVDELEHFRAHLIAASVGGSWGAMRSPIDGLPLKVERLAFGECIGCGWLQVLTHHTRNNHGAKWGFNTYLKEVKKCKI